MSERLEKAKKILNHIKGYGVYDGNDDIEIFEWLIEQAERVQELEVWYHSYHKEAKLNNILKIQNKRYREALEEIMKIQENHEWNLYGLAYGIAERILFEVEGEE